VSRARDAIIQEPASRRVAAFTSGGPIGACVQAVMQAPLSMAMEINWRVRNTSITEILYSRDRISLDTFNGVPHLTDAALLTFR
jgi:broad specificity phosphatase PhoE